MLWRGLPEVTYDTLLYSMQVVRGLAGEGLKLTLMVLERCLILSDPGMGNGEGTIVDYTKRKKHL